MKYQGNGVFERGGQWFMDPSRVKMSRVGMGPLPAVTVGPFASLDEADAAASYVFAAWVQTGKIPAVAEVLAAIHRHYGGTE